MSGKGIGFGKTILFGEHFVVYNLPSIASAIFTYTIAEVEEGTQGLELIDNRPAIEGYKTKKQGEIKRSLDLIMKYLNIDLEKTPLKITLSGQLKCASGIGASAALASSIARGLNEHFSLGLNDKEINEVAYEGEKGSAGNPSGIDNTCSTYGGFLTFEKGEIGEKNKIERIKVKEPIPIVLVSTGITQETKEIVADIKKLKNENPEKYEKMFTEYKEIFKQGLESLKNGDIKKLGELMNKNMDLLREMTLSCKEIEKIISIAKENEALGVKLTGTGRGGLVICLVPNEEIQFKVSKAIEQAGFEATKTMLK